MDTAIKAVKQETGGNQQVKDDYIYTIEKISLIRAIIVMQCIHLVLKTTCTNFIVKIFNNYLLFFCHYDDICMVNNST